GGVFRHSEDNKKQQSAHRTTCHDRRNSMSPHALPRPRDALTQIVVFVVFRVLWVLSAVPPMCAPCAARLQKRPDLQNPICLHHYALPGNARTQNARTMCPI